MKNFSNRFKYFLTLGACSLPAVTYAAGKTFKDLVSLFASYFNMALLLLIGFAVLSFVFYIIRFFVLPYDKRAEAWEYVMYSLIGFFIVLSMWGLVNILVATFDLGTGSPTTWTGLKNLFPTL